MPELPEVEGFATYFKKTSLNKKIVDVSSSHHRMIKNVSFDTFKKDLLGKKFTGVARKGKYLIIDISGSDKKLIMHFALTGSLTFTDDTTTKIPYARVVFFFPSGALHWIAKRTFEKLWIVDDPEKIAGIKNIGVDALKITEKAFTTLIEERPGKNIKGLLMEQTLIAGIGNEYSDEILFQAGIGPHHKAGDLSAALTKKLYKKIREVLTYAVAMRKKYIHKLDETTFFSASHRETFKKTYISTQRSNKLICPKNKNHRLKKATIAGRTSYYCPEHQA